MEFYLLSTCFSPVVHTACGDSYLPQAIVCRPTNGARAPTRGSKTTDLRQGCHPSSPAPTRHSKWIFSSAWANRLGYGLVHACRQRTGKHLRESLMFTVPFLSKRVLYSVIGMKSPSKMRCRPELDLCFFKSSTSRGLRTPKALTSSNANQ